MAHDFESDALDSILNDLDKMEGKEVCESCGKPVDDSEEVSPGVDKVEAGKPDVHGMKVTIEPMTPEQAKDKIKELTSKENDKEDEDSDLPFML